MRALALVLLLAGCVAQPKVDSIEDSIAYTATGIASAATLVRELCRNTEPGGECAPDAMITTGDKERAKAALQQSLNYVGLANASLADGESAEEELAVAETLLRAVRDELSRYSQ